MVLEKQGPFIQFSFAFGGRQPAELDRHIVKAAGAQPAPEMAQPRYNHAADIELDIRPGQILDDGFQPELAHLRDANVSCFQEAPLVLDYLRKGKIVVPDLILLDINMPEMDGWEFLYHLDRMGISSDVMMLSSSIHWEDISKARNFDRVKCYIEKPLTEDKIEEFIVQQNFVPLDLD